VNIRKYSVTSEREVIHLLLCYLYHDVLARATSTVPKRSPMERCHKVTQYSTLQASSNSFAQQVNLTRVSKKTSGKMWPCKLHRAPIRQPAAHQDIQPKIRHRQLWVTSWHCLNTAPEIF